MADLLMLEWLVEDIVVVPGARIMVCPTGQALYRIQELENPRNRQGAVDADLQFPIDDNVSRAFVRNK